MSGEMRDLVVWAAVAVGVTGVLCLLAFLLLPSMPDAVAELIGGGCGMVGIVAGNVVVNRMPL